MKRSNVKTHISEIAKEACLDHYLRSLVLERRGVKRNFMESSYTLQEANVRYQRDRDQI